MWETKHIRKSLIYLNDQILNQWNLLYNQHSSYLKWNIQSELHNRNIVGFLGSWMVGSVWLQDSLVTFQKRSVNLLPDIQGSKHELETHPLARDWTAAAVPWPYSPPGPSHTLPPHMTSPACWPLKQSNRDECWVFTKPGRGTRAACPSLSPQTFLLPHSCSQASAQDPYVEDCYCITSPSSSSL